MKNFFSMDSKFFTFMGKVADAVILNLLFLVTSLPIITIGASLAALYTVTLKQSEGTSAYIVKEYFHAWKNNFRQSTLLWIFSLIVYALLFMNLSIKTTGSISLLLHGTMVLTLILYTMVLLYAFPLLAKFNNTLKHTIVNALFLSIRHFLTTCMLLGTTFFFVFITVFSPQSLFEPMIVAWMLLIFAFIARMQSEFLNRVFTRYLPQTEV